MNWKRYKEIPYRGQLRPKYPKPRRQIRDLKLERGERNKTITLTFVILSLVGIFIALPTSSLNANLALVLFGFLFLLGLFISVAIADGFKTINKFRPGYDFDSSELDKDEKEEMESKGDSEL